VQLIFCSLEVSELHELINSFIHWFLPDGGIVLLALPSLRFWFVLDMAMSSFTACPSELQPGALGLPLSGRHGEL